MVGDEQQTSRAAAVVSHEMEHGGVGVKPSVEHWRGGGRSECGMLPILEKPAPAAIITHRLFVVALLVRPSGAVEEQRGSICHPF
jgi:hypothetical protein